MNNDQFTYNPGKRPQSEAVPSEGSDKTVQKPANSATPTNKVVNWQASEFIEHNKNFGWFFGLIAGAVVIAALMYLLTRNILAVVVIVLAGVAVGQYAKSKPATNDYELSLHGLKVNGKFYALSDFRSFAIYQEGAINALYLVSAKRFATPLTVYFAPDDYQKIVDLLQRILPQDAYKPDTIDKMMKRVRF
jgi:hypothetical protein